MHSIRMRTARLSGRLFEGSLPRDGCLPGGCLPSGGMPGGVDRQAPLKILPCPKIRLWAVITKIHTALIIHVRLKCY